ncbi:MAG: DUF6077 domain-containing protein [Lachnospiraceae bacterium]|nr:DUF6077 domain-containing protein [Lachnospiraceae bacterium]
MNIWLQILITIYSLGIMPFLVGMMWTRRGALLGLAETYVMGYISIWALFYLFAVPMIVMELPLSTLTGCWRGIMVAVPVLWLLQFLIRRNTFLRQLQHYRSNMERIRQFFSYVIILAALFTLISIGFIMPSPEDDVPETVAITIDTNRMYRQQPYTKLAYSEPELKQYSPIEMFYAVNVDVSGMEVPIFVHSFLPIFLLAFFYASTWEISGVLFRGKPEERGLFVVFAMILYTVSIGADRAVSFSVFQNIWNGATMLCCCILPLVVAFGFEIIDSIQQKKKLDYEMIVMVILTIVAAQLMLAKGAVLSVLSLICCVGIYVIRKGWERFGSVRKH